jgi:hypothetical protein
VDVRAPSQPAYRRLTRADLELIAHRHVRGASDGAIARELDVDRSSVRRARKRPAALELIAAERKRELKRAESQRYRDRKKERERAEREADPAAEVANQSEHAAHQAVNPPSLSGEPGYRRQRQEGGRILNISTGTLGDSKAAYMDWLDEHDIRAGRTPPRRRG